MYDDRIKRIQDTTRPMDELLSAARAATSPLDKFVKQQEESSLRLLAQLDAAARPMKDLQDRIDQWMTPFHDIERRNKKLFDQLAGMTTISDVVRDSLGSSSVAALGRDAQEAMAPLKAIELQNRELFEKINRTSSMTKTARDNLGIGTAVEAARKAQESLAVSLPRMPDTEREIPAPWMPGITPLIEDRQRDRESKEAVIQTARSQTRMLEVLEGQWHETQRQREQDQKRELRLRQERDQEEEFQRRRSEAKEDRRHAIQILVSVVLALFLAWLQINF